METGGLILRVHYKRWVPPPPNLALLSFFVTTIASPLLRQCHFFSIFSFFRYFQSLFSTASSTIHLIYYISPIFQTIFHINHQLSITVILQDAHIRFIRNFSHRAAGGVGDWNGLEILSSNWESFADVVNLQGWRDQAEYSCPKNTKNDCTADEKNGFDWSDLPEGKVSNYKGYNFSGWDCASKLGKRNLEGRHFSVRSFHHVLALVSLILTKYRANALNPI